jgi:hypothetical protein
MARAQPKKAKPKRSARDANPGIWLGRALAVLLVGSGVGVAGGAFAVNRLEPGRGTGVDSLQVMLDSIAKGRIPKKGTVAAPPPDIIPYDTLTGTMAPPTDSTAGLSIPEVRGLEEGPARDRLRDAGFRIAGVEFRASGEPAGTVLQTIPAGGLLVPRETQLTLVLSDGKLPVDSLAPLRP